MEERKWLLEACPGQRGREEIPWLPPSSLLLAPSLADPGQELADRGAWSLRNTFSPKHQTQRRQRAEREGASEGKRVGNGSEGKWARTSISSDLLPGHGSTYRSL